MGRRKGLEKVGNNIGRKLRGWGPSEAQWRKHLDESFMSNIAKDSSKKKKKSTFGFGKIKVFSDFDETSGNDSLCKMS